MAMALKGNSYGQDRRNFVADLMREACMHPNSRPIYSSLERMWRARKPEAGRVNFIAD